jgi:hypothetical protein
MPTACDEHGSGGSTTGWVGRLELRFGAA